MSSRMLPEIVKIGEVIMGSNSCSNQRLRLQSQINSLQMLRNKNEELSRQERIAEINHQNRNYNFSNRPSVIPDEFVEIEQKSEQERLKEILIRRYQQQ
jgi:hypothetical protein